MTMEKFKRVDNTRRLCHLGIMLRLVESLAAKVERGKWATVQFMPLRSRPIGYKCDWCGRIGNGKQKGWISFKAVDCSSGFETSLTGDVWERDECRISVQAKYPRNSQSQSGFNAAEVQRGTIST
jgi:hypothetical protein